MAIPDTDIESNLAENIDLLTRLCPVRQTHDLPTPPAFAFVHWRIAARTYPGTAESLQIQSEMHLTKQHTRQLRRPAIQRDRLSKSATHQMTLLFCAADQRPKVFVMSGATDPALVNRDACVRFRYADSTSERSMLMLPTSIDADFSKASISS